MLLLLQNIMIVNGTASSADDAHWDLMQDKHKVNVRSLQLVLQIRDVSLIHSEGIYAK